MSNNNVVVSEGSLLKPGVTSGLSGHISIAWPPAEITVRLIGPSVIARAVESLLNEHRISTDAEDASVLVLLPPYAVSFIAAQSSRTVRTGGGDASAKRTGYVLLTDGSDLSARRPQRGCPYSLVGIDDHVSALISGIEAAARGESYCSPSLLTALMCGATDLPKTASTGMAESRGEHRYAAPPIPAQSQNMGVAETLSRRECEIAQKAATGLSNEEIAETLHISIATVKFHLFHAFRKLGIVRRSQIAAAIGYAPGATEPALQRAA